MKIALGSDHGGFALKGDIIKFLVMEGYRVIDYGTKSPEACDYPIFAYKVAKAVSEKKVNLGILICKTGNGMAMMANKLPHVRAAICFDKNVAVLSRLHNDANILVLGSEHLFDDPELIVRSWLESGFEAGRHKRRVDQMSRLEGKICEKKKAVRARKPRAKK
ncbi:MAG: ribose 5-phosphate isomerase B [Candidatus Omnitrophica bacterium CG07_land_8_20_14_0_80_50_8]|nr:MAG: ribose 5-phosphate isomerase B [Candidatus Omnitrophica bacterium CG07_land_8_20_14_0_80_50_8]